MKIRKKAAFAAAAILALGGLFTTAQNNSASQRPTLYGVAF